jgi:site-specific DNA-methyltransferase (adenine-specific)
MDAESIDAIVSDPPYGLSFMGKGWDHGVPGQDFWIEALRVAKPGAHLLAFGGTRTFHRLAVAIEDAGWEIRDCLMWVYGSGFPKSLNIGGGWGTALKPAYEPIIMARKPLTSTVAANVLKHGTGAINVDGCRVGHRKERPLMRAAGMGYHGSEAQGMVTDGGMGRWPANVLHDGSDEVTALFPTTTSGGTPFSRPSGMGYHGAAGQDDVAGSRGDSGSAARFFYCAKASKADRDEGCAGLEVKKRTDGRESEHHTDHLRTNERSNHHPTIKPTDLMRYLCRLVTPPGGTVLDPFMGSGSTGKAATLEGFRFVGCELQPEYMAIAEARIKHAEGNVEPLLRVRS